MPVEGRACSACGYINLPGEGFCQKCGVQLAPVASAPPPPPDHLAGLAGTESRPHPPTDQSTAPFAKTRKPYGSEFNPHGEPLFSSAIASPPAMVSGKLSLPGSNEIIAIPPGKQQIVIGRADPAGEYFPDIDLSLYGGEQAGVSRRHARLIARGLAGSIQVFIEDLNSTNFTFLNGQALQPSQPYPLKHGDTVQFGRLSLTYITV